MSFSELEYEYCNGGDAATYGACRASCQAMNTADKSGWDLAIIPTQYHNEVIMQKLAVDYPLEESTTRLNYFWIGLMWVHTILFLLMLIIMSPKTILP